MFTGIVTDLGRVRAVVPTGGGRDRRLLIETRYPVAEIAIGASIACAGCCLTMVEAAAGCLAFDVSAETLACTTLGDWAPGRAVNLERSLRMGDELGGHIVSGHVDGVGEVADFAADGSSTRFRFRAPAELGRFIAPKGSVAVDGVSLTVNAVVDDAEGTTCFTVNVIPHTAAVTSLGMTRPGDRVNLEVDLMARYAARLAART